MQKEEPKGKARLIGRPRLREMQLWMRWVITEPNGVRSALKGERKLPFDGPHVEPMRRLLDQIEEASPLSREGRLDIYAEAYFSRLCENLADDFETTVRLVGQERFRGLVSAYLSAHPSHVFSAVGVGRFFPKFVARHPLARQFPFLKDLMRMEWLTIETFFAAEPTPLQAVTDWENARFRLGPAARLMRATYNVDALWREETDVAERGARRILVYRDIDSVKIQTLDEIQYQVLRGLAARLTLGEICVKIEEQLSETCATAPPPLMEWFQGWVTNGVVAS